MFVCFEYIKCLFFSASAVFPRTNITFNITAHRLASSVLLIPSSPPALHQVLLRNSYPAWLEENIACAVITTQSHNKSEDLIDPNLRPKYACSEKE